MPRPMFAFLGAILSDLLALSVALKAGQLAASKWRSPGTYLGILIYGIIATVIEVSLEGQINGPLAALSVGLNLPLVLQNLAKLTPTLQPAAPAPSLPTDTGFAGESAPAERANETIPRLESLRQFIAKER